MICGIRYLLKYLDHRGSIAHDGSMVLLFMVTWIPSIYPLYVSIYTSTMDPMGMGYYWNIYIYGIVMDIYGLLMGYYWLVGG